MAQATLVNEDRAKPRGLLGLRDFRLLWIGQAISLLGDQFSLLAFPWLVLQLAGNGLAMGTVLALAGVPRALLMLVGGAVTDRVSPRALMLASNLARVVLMGLLAALTLGGAVQLWMLYVVSLLFGVVDAFFFPAASAILPRIVGNERLGPANALTQGTAQVSVFLGPVLAGAVISLLAGQGAGTPAGAGLFGLGVAFAITAAGFLVSALMLSLLRMENTAGASSVTGQEDQKAESVFGSIRAGLAAVLNDPPLRTFFLLIAGINLLISGPFAVGIPVLARERFAEGVIAVGVISSSFGGGSLVGILLAGVLKTGGFERNSRMLTLLISGLGIGLIAFGLSVTLAVSAVVTLAMGAANGFVTVQFITWLQRRTPPAMLGRMMSLLMFAAVGLQPISTALAGPLVDLDVTTLFVGAGVLLTALVLAVATRPALRRMDAATPTVLSTSETRSPEFTEAAA